MQEWFEQYGLDRDPFEAGGVSGLFFPGGGRSEGLEQVEHLARFSQTLIMVAGPLGIGKTNFAEALQTRAGPECTVCRIEAGLLDNPDLLLRRVCNGFGLSTEGAPNAIADAEALIEWMQSPERGERHAWLMVDDAHHLDAEGAAALCSLAQGGQERFALILLAEPTWETVIRDQLLAAQDLHVIPLAALGRSDTIAYISYRMNTAGLSDELPFSGTELEEIGQSSAGIPARINRVAAAVLQTASEDTDQAVASLPVWHIAVVGLTLGALLLLYLWGAAEDQPERPAISSALSPPVVVARPAPEPDPMDEASRSEPEIAPLADPNGEDTTDETDSNGVSDPVNTVTDTDGGMEPGMHSASPARPPGSMAQNDYPDAEPPVTPGAHRSADEDYLLSLPKSHFTLQLMSSADPRVVERYRKALTISVQSFRKMHQGEEWMAVVYGNFPTRMAAENAIPSLLPALKASPPWIRPVSAVQDDIRSVDPD